MHQKDDADNLKSFNNNGFVVKRNLFSASEVRLILEALQTDPRVHANIFTRTDKNLKETLAVQWNNPGESSFGIGARMYRVVDVVEALLEGEVYHWQSKVAAKEAREGGAWEWHQDYGYWYNYGCLYPDMCSVMLALDRSVEANGCLKVLKGSHKIGRINHIRDAGGQVNADPERVAWALNRHEAVACELEPGDALFFHCNLLHASGFNTSNLRRWVILFCYNRVTNDPFTKSHNPSYRKLIKVDDKVLMENGVRLSDGSEDFQSTYVNK